MYNPKITIMKKFKSLVLTVIGLLCSVSVSAHDFEADGIYYNITSADDKTVEVTFSGDSYYAGEEYSGSVTISETVTYNDNTYSVTSIGDYAFFNCYSLTSVEIPNSVTSIGSSAFRYCSSLTSVEIPNSVTSIEYYAFYGCYNLRVVLNNSNLTFTKGNSSYGYIAYNAYVVCNGYEQVDDFIFTEEDDANYLRAYIGNATELVLPTNYKGGNYGIGDYAFYDCYGLTSVEIPNSVTSIGESAFEGCASLTSVVIGNSVTSIGVAAFWGCSSLTAITVTEGNSRYDSRDNCNAIIETQTNTLIAGCSETTIPNSVTSIGSSAFAKCSSLISVEIPNSVTSIGSSAFSGCSRLTSVEIPNSLTSIGDYAFYGCSSLTSVVIPNSVTSIGDYAFYGCSSLSSVEIPNSVTSIGMEAFFGCSSLTSVEIPNSVTSIGHAAFVFCSSLTSVEIPNSVISIGGYAFDSCYGLTSVEIPNSVTSIGEGAFSGCSGLTSIAVAENNQTYDSRNNCNAIIETQTNTLIAGCSKTTIPNSVTSIGDFAFEDCSSLTSVVIPNSVTSIGEYAFSGCSGLTSITSHIPANNLFPIKSDVFEFVDKSNCTLNVPYGAKEKYESTAGWNEFTNIVELIENSTYHELTYIVDSLVYQTDSVFAGDSIKLPEPPTKEGYTFVG